MRPAALVVLLFVSACGEPTVNAPDAGGVTAPDAATSCEPPRELCNGRCVNPETDPLHCGGCNMECAAGSFCSARSCARVCSAGLQACGGSCVDLATDREHCGRCDQPCGADRDCRGGSCGCPTGYTECNGACVNPMADPAHCGLCDRACTPEQTCSMGSCRCAGGERETECNDGADNDCDRLIDCADSDCLGSTRACQGSCGPGVESCQGGGVWGMCTGGDGSAEICGDGIDQDCSGADQRVPDDWEPNDRCDACPLIMGQNPNGFIVARFDSIEDDTDCYRFEAVDTSSYQEHIRVTLEDIPAGHDYDVYLYRDLAACESRTALAQSAASGNADENIDWGESFGSSDSGTYYVRVVRFAGHSCTQDYRLTVNGLR